MRCVFHTLGRVGQIPLGGTLSAQAHRGESEPSDMSFQWDMAPEQD